MKIYSMFIIRHCRGLSVKGGHDLIVHWRTFMKLVTFSNFIFYLFIHSVFFCASYSPFAQVSCICPPGWNTREITPVMQGNPELKGMNDLIIWKTIGSETRTNRAQKVASLEVLPTFLAITRTAKFFCTIWSRRLSLREMRISTRWSLALHSNRFLSGIFPIAKTSLITISDFPLSIRKLA